MITFSPSVDASLMLEAAAREAGSDDEARKKVALTALECSKVALPYWRRMYSSGEREEELSQLIESAEHHVQQDDVQRLTDLLDRVEALYIEHCEEAERAKHTEGDPLVVEARHNVAAAAASAARAVVCAISSAIADDAESAAISASGAVNATIAAHIDLFADDDVDPDAYWPAQKRQHAIARCAEIVKRHIETQSTTPSS